MRFRAPVKTFVAAAAALLVFPAAARAHCDTLDGPVVAAARVALEKGDVGPTLKWVKPEAEPQLREAFRRALAVRASGGEARSLADTYFFETVVRLHRAGEGAPYTGLKPAGASATPAIVAADKALDAGSAQALVALVTADVASGIRERFERVVEARKHADESVEAGRAFVDAYVEYVHYVEGLGAPAHEAAGTNTAPRRP